MILSRQSGIALITVLLVLSLATVAAVAMTTRQQLDIRRTTNILNIEQAYMALLAAEEFARRGLIEDAKDNQTDAFNDLWADPQLQIAVQDIGNFKVTNFFVEDLQGRFNITNLLDAAGQNVDANQHRNFARLLRELALPETLADAAIDWMDSNVNQYNNGAEDDAYSALETPYRTPNGLMASASELFRLNGVNLAGIQDAGDTNLKYREKICSMLIGDELNCRLTSEPDPNIQNQFNQEQKLLVALPERTPVNVNTIVSPVIYMMMLKGLGRSDAESIYSEIGIEKGETAKFTSADAFWKHPKVLPLNVPEAERVEISFSSNYFLFRAQAIDKNNADFVVYLNTILKRSGNQGAFTVQVVRRSFGKAGEI